MFTWDAKTGEKKCRFKLAKGARGVAAVAISEDGSLVACVDCSNEHCVSVFNATTGALVFKSAGDTNKIFDIAFSNEPGSCRLATAGQKHFYFWDAAAGGDKKKGLFNGNEPTSFSCVAWDNCGKAYAGGANACIYVFDQETRSSSAIIKAHK